SRCLLLTGIFQFACKGGDLFFEIGGACVSGRRLAHLGPSCALPLRQLFATTASLHASTLRRGHDDAPSQANPPLSAMTRHPLWVRSRHVRCTRPCLLYPQ